MRPLALVALIWALWFATGLVTIAIGLAAGAYVHQPGWPVRHGLWPLFSWDYGRYDRIASSGYPAGTDGSRYAFYPLWPLLLRASGPVPDAAIAAGLAWVASAAAFTGVAGGWRSTSWRSAVALACWPGSFALLLAYPDGLALAAAAWSVVLAKRGRPLAAGTVGAIAALARPNGVLAAVPLAWLARGRGSRSWIGAAVPIAAAGAVQAYFWAQSGSATVFFHAQRRWGRRGPGHWLDSTWALTRHHVAPILLAVVVAAAAAALMWRRFGFLRAASGIYAVAVVLLLARAHHLRSRIDDAVIAAVAPLLVVLWRLGRAWRPWAVFSTLVVVALLLSGQTESFRRQVLFAFPIFWALGEGPPWLRRLPLAVLGLAGNVALVLLLTRFPP